MSHDQDVLAAAYRAGKVARIVEWLDADLTRRGIGDEPGAVARILRAQEDSFWDAIAAAAGCTKPPSFATCEAVIVVYQLRHRAAESEKARAQQRKRVVR